MSHREKATFMSNLITLSCFTYEDGATEPRTMSATQFLQSINVMADLCLTEDDFEKLVETGLVKLAEHNNHLLDYELILSVMSVIDKVPAAEEESEPVRSHLLWVMQWKPRIFTRERIVNVTTRWLEQERIAKQIATTKRRRDARIDEEMRALGIKV